MSRRSNSNEAYDWLPAKGGERNAKSAADDAPVVPGGGAPAPNRRRRKKTGKRSNPEYVQRSFYVPDNVDRRVRQALLAQEDRVQYSDFLTALLIEWLERVDWPLEEEE